MYLQREKTDASKLAPLGAAYNSLPQQAVEYSLACVALPGDVSTFAFWEIFHIFLLSSADSFRNLFFFCLLIHNHSDHSFDPDLGSICLQMISVDDKIRH